MNGKTVLSLVLLVITFSLLINVVYAETWVEIGRWAGGTGYTGTGYFRTTHECWRIRYYINLSSNAECRMDVYYNGEEESFALIYAYNEPSEGVLEITQQTAERFPYIENSVGVFHIDVLMRGEGSYLLIVEQDVDSIPEFTPLTLVLIILLIFASTVALKKKGVELKL